MRRLASIIWLLFLVVGCNGRSGSPPVLAEDSAAIDAPDADLTAADQDAADPDASVLLPQPCSPCVTEADCAVPGGQAEPVGGQAGELDCLLLVSGNKYCMARCTDSAHCLPAASCQQVISGAVLHCMPNTYDCPHCAATGCPPDTYCSGNGSCRDIPDLCDNCESDAMCPSGAVCRQDGNTKRCMPRCSKTIGCPSGSTCVTKAGVGWCIYGGATCCYGPDCDNSCPDCDGTCLGGVCAGCLTDADCAQGWCQWPAWQCGLCPAPGYPEKKVWDPASGTCIECVVDSDCSSTGEYLEVCAQNVCVGSCKVCGGTYPICAELFGVWQCVECTNNNHCEAKDLSECSTTTFTCNNPGPIPKGNCKTDADCWVPADTEFALYCHLDSGYCMDKGGKCDNIHAFCNFQTGENCKTPPDNPGATIGTCQPAQ
jgi:hypothetical protein